MLGQASPQTPHKGEGLKATIFSHSEEMVDEHSKVGVSKAGVTCGPRYPLIHAQALCAGRYPLLSLTHLV
ncbi:MULTISPECIES: hypothetical protein [unclassified Mucilaginibacter]|uniref:hypothetical protein n=1 Tax=unclassified Mucilaginibacter TaxID=2617802 RepID=UPI00095CF047|nr:MULTISPECIES: hypothetical protein [unclassified Mucilaginibacter]OJW13493.1 MAG: hypothetical protein BGO48_01680 [Mucilaginibacter sp. 44-25]PLW89130.1 MAG: hypothetical protein C0154_13110 [Mucilaginibacter sp.]HEK22303.1 hypothetical protein [Bacteroidota bacterium]